MTCEMIVSPMNLIDDELISNAAQCVTRKTNFTNEYLVEQLYKPVSFYYQYLNDKRFDLFTLPEDFFDHAPIGLEICFFDQHFQVINPGKISDSFNFPYQNDTYDILYSLESGVISSSFLPFLSTNKVRFWENGKIICHVIDRRFNANSSFLICLKCSKETLIGNEVPQESIFKIALLNYISTQQNPELCLDPNPNVARVFSSLDFREKMWLNTESQFIPEIKKSEPARKPTQRLSAFDPNVTLSEQTAEIFYRISKKMYDH